MTFHFSTDSAIQCDICLDIIRRFSPFFLSKTKTRSRTNFKWNLGLWTIYTSRIQANIMCDVLFAAVNWKVVKKVWYTAIFCGFFYDQRFETINRPSQLIGSWFQNSPLKEAHQFDLYEFLASNGTVQNMALNILLPGERWVLNFPLDFAFRLEEKRVNATLITVHSYFTDFKSQNRTTNVTIAWCWNIALGVYWNFIRILFDQNTISMTARLVLTK